MKINEILEKYGDIELKDEEVKELIKKYKKSKVWKPEDGEKYYTIHYGGNHDYEKESYKIGDVYKTREKAEFALEKQRVYTELKRYALEHNDREIDWSSLDKYVLVYDHKEQKLVIFQVMQRAQELGQIYFTSEEVAQNAIKEIGEDRIKKYLFEVE